MKVPTFDYLVFTLELVLQLPGFFSQGLVLVDHSLEVRRRLGSLSFKVFCKGFQFVLEHGAVLLGKCELLAGHFKALAEVL